MTTKKLFVYLVIVTFITSVGVSFVSCEKTDTAYVADISSSEQLTSIEKINIVLSAEDFEIENGAYINSVVLFHSNYEVTIQNAEIRYNYRNLNGLSRLNR